ncbi:MAG: type II toxin-antitoxin system VapC family toxin [Lapillicoccus sp.]
MLLLDTHVLLWLLTDDRRLGTRGRSLVSGSGTTYVSAASLWEIAIKADLGKIEAPDDLPSLIVAAGLTWLPVSPQHAWRSRSIAGLPHRDPFDRVLISQAVCESLIFLTADRALLGSELVPVVEVVDARL